MIYDSPTLSDPLDQGDLIDDCPILTIRSYDSTDPSAAGLTCAAGRGIVLTQTCDVVNEKAIAATVAEVFDAQFLVDQKMFKPADIKGPLRAGRIWGWYFLPADSALGLSEMVVDLRRVHTIRLDLLRGLCAEGKRLGRVQPLYREHLAKHFADTFCRIGLPRPYESL